MIRILSSLVLAFVLALTSQSMAVARGAAAATGKMVLCTGSGPVAIYMDAQGKPTSAPHICPDAALHVLDDRQAPPGAASPVLLYAGSVRRAAAGVRLVLPQALPRSRAPPLAV